MSEMTLRDVLRLWLGPFGEGGGSDPALQAKLDELEALLGSHLANHPAGEGGGLGAPIEIAAECYNHELIPLDALRPSLHIWPDGVLHFFVEVVAGGKIPGGNKNVENYPILIMPTGIVTDDGAVVPFAIPSADTVPLIIKMLEARGDGAYWNEENDFMIPFVTRWSRSEQFTGRRWVIKMQMHQDGTQPHGKRYLSKWPRTEDERDFVMKGGDRPDHFAGWIPIY